MTKTSRLNASIVTAVLCSSLLTMSALGAEPGQAGSAPQAETRTPPAPDASPVSVSFADLGIQGKARVRDLWKRENTGVFDGLFTTEIPIKGGRLFRIPAQP